MTNEEIINSFPEHERIKRTDIAPVIEDIFNQAKTYHDVEPLIMKKCEELYPKPELLRGRTPEYDAWTNYFWGRYDEHYNKVDDQFQEWVRAIEQEFLSRRGQVRSYDEACRVAADQWVGMCFGDHVQDNGDRSETGFFGNALATMVADLHKDGITKETIEKARQKFYEYYANEYEPHRISKELYCDYNPNLNLANILKSAGLDDMTIDCICPIKTGVSIDEKDHSVVIEGYRKRTYV